MGHYIQWNKASVFIKIHWTLNATNKECKTKKRCDTIFREKRQELSPRYIGLWMLQQRSVRQKQDVTLYSGKQGKCFLQIHWTLNATTEECKTKTRCDTIFTETRQVLSSTYIGLWMLQPRSVKKKQDGTLYSGKQGKWFH